MASRQNRKKKGRASQQNRERTVTTLTEDPNTSFLIPTPSEELGGANIMSSPFSVASSSGGAGPNSSIPNGNYQLQNTFGYSGGAYNNSGYIASMQHGPNVHQQQQQNPQLQQVYQHQLTQLGGDDSEKLENLKAKIKAGQHEFFRPVPQPLALLSVYSEGLHPDILYNIQQGADYQGAGFNQTGYEVGSATSDTGTKTALSTESSRGVPRIQTKDAGDPSGPERSIHSSPSSQSLQPGNRYGANKAQNVTPPPSKPGNDTRSVTDSKTPVISSASSDVTQPPQSRFGVINLDQRDQDAGSEMNGQRRPPGESPTTGEYGRARALSDVSPVKSSFDDKGDARPGRDSAWQSREGLAAQDDKRGRPEPDRPGPNNNADSRSNGNDTDTRGPMPRDQRFYDRERDRDRDRDRDRERDWDRDRDRDRRPDYRDRGRMTDTRRPPPEQRHYEPRYNSDLPRRNDARPPVDDVMDIDKRPPPPPMARPGAIDDRPVRAPVDDRVPPRAPPLDRSRVPPVNDRHARPLPGDNRGAPSPEDRSLRSAPSQTIQDASPRLSAMDRNAVRGPPSPVDDRIVRPAVPLEDRIGRPPPSLQDRITHAPASRADDRLVRQPSLEERISLAPAAANDRPIPHDDRAVRPSTADRTARPAEPIRPPIQEERMGRPDDRSVRPGPPGDRYVRPVTPRGAGYAALPRPASVVRDDPRVLRTPPSPPPGRDYRPIRPPSRERDLRPPHRPEVDRPYDIDRRPDLIDVDPSTRFNDSRPPYQRRLTPPPDRPRGVYPPQSPPPAFVEPDRRYPAGDRRDYQYEDGYWKPQARPASWDRDAPDKERIQRGVLPRNNGWETREERERRNSFPGSPSARPLETSQVRPLGSRLTDGYSGPGEDRPYPPRELERPRYPGAPVEGAPAFSRVRPRSPSPIARRPGPGGLIDDMRPPTKRVREDAPYPPAGYYVPEPRRPAAAGSPNDYTPRTGPTPRSEGGYYDTRLTPVPPGGRNGPPYDRDYPVGRDRAPDVGGYVPGPSSYDRPPRSPPSRLHPPAYGRGNYNRGGGDPRDDRAYNNMPPPPPRSS